MDGVDLKTSKRVLIAPHEIAGYYNNLATGFSEIGVDVDFVTYSPHPFAYGNRTKQPGLIRLSHRISSGRGKPGRSLRRKIVVWFLSNTLSNLWGFSAIFRYDYFIFGFGKSLLWRNMDLPVLFLLRKRVVMNFSHGSDSRPPFINGALQGLDGLPQEAKTVKKLARKSSQKLGFAFRSGAIVVGAPFSTSQYATKPFINTFALGLPVTTSSDHRLAKEAPHDNPGLGGAISILHSPSHPAAKGSREIAAAIDSLKGRGFEIDFVLIQGRPNNEVIQAIKSCTFVVDQIYSDTPLAGFATEAAKFGKAAVVGGYQLLDLRKYFPDDLFPPSYTCQPEDIEQAIERLIVDGDFRDALGNEAHDFVFNVWQASQVAERYLQVLNGEAPREWWLEPSTIFYLHGAGQTLDRTKQVVESVIRRFGVRSLQLSHRPDLEKAFIKMADLDEASPISLSLESDARSE